MSSQGLSIAQAACKLGISTRTVRRYIKAGKIKAELIDGRFGEEYRIFELSPELCQSKAEIEIPAPSKNTGQIPIQAMDIIRELQEKNLALAARLGATTERIRNLENQIKLLTAAKLPWWKRLLAKRIR
jgi:excisionase family DNA binding protein